MVTTSASSLGGLMPIDCGNGAVTAVALRPRSRKQLCPCQVTSKCLLLLRNPVHSLGRGHPDQVESALQGGAGGSAGLEPSSCEPCVVDDDAEVTIVVARLVEGADPVGQLVDEVRQPVRL